MIKTYLIPVLFISLLMGSSFSNAKSDLSGKNDSTALLVIDIQQFYFEGKGKLEGCIEASLQAKKLLEYYRSKRMLVVHVKHGDTSPIHPNVSPIPGEKVIVKNEVNSFKGTDLQEFLLEHHIKRLVLCGMMTHMCLEAATRAAADLGYECTVIQDACATRNLVFGTDTVKARDVHISTLATLTYYGKVISLDEYFAMEQK
jgi:nicotinamidase-related amidase